MVAARDDRLTNRGSGVRRAFDRAAPTFDAVAALPREIASRMLERLSLVRLPAATVLDLGCATGHGARSLQQRYRNALVLELDVSEKMLRQAQARAGRNWLWRRRKAQRRAVCADFARLPVAPSRVDLIWSNLALHWSADLPGVLAEAYRVLRPGGLLMFSLFGPDTLQELRVASSGGGFRVNAQGDMHDIGDMLVQAGYADPVMDMEQLTLTYVDVAALLRDLQAHGSKSTGGEQQQGLFGRSRYRRVIAQYEPMRRADGRLPATFEVIYGHAWKPQPRRAASGKPVIEIRPA